MASLRELEFDADRMFSAWGFPILEVSEETGPVVRHRQPCVSYERQFV